MKTNVLFLGTSAGWPLPRLGCSCDICNSKNPKDKRLRPSILINNQVLIDAGFDIYHQINTKKVDPKKIRYILLTHAHDDHIMGLYDLSHIYGKKTNIEVISTNGILSHTKKRLGISTFSFKLTNRKENNEFPISNNIYITFLRVKHTVECIAIKIRSTQNKTFIYAPEFSKLPQKTYVEFKKADILVIDGTSLDKSGKTRGHQTILEGIKIFKKTNVKRIIFTNIGHKTLPHEKLYKYLKKIADKRFEIAYDGLKINF